jgi:hypothetical protein
MFKVKYRLSHIEESAAPVRGQGGCWHRYVIDGGSSPIVGHHRGTKQQTEAYALEFTENLNHRWREGVVPSGYRTRKAE